jgi:hypothetical protein
MTLADRFFRDAQKINNIADPAIHRSYREFLAYFAGLQESQKSNFLSTIVRLSITREGAP